VRTCQRLNLLFYWLLFCSLGAVSTNVFKTQTYDALVKDAKQLGLTTVQAQKLATSYFDLPKDVATKVRAIGTDPVVTVLNEIGKQLSYLTHQPWVSTVKANTGAANAALGHTKSVIETMPNGKQIQINVATSLGCN